MIYQHDSNDCACACLAMVCKYYGKDFSLTKLRDILGTDIKGTPINGLHHGAEELGFVAQKVRITKEAMKDKFTVPAICHIRTDEGGSHFVVLMKNNKRRVIILDPAKGVLKLKVDKFFENFDGLIIILAPQQEFYKINNEKNNLLKSFTKLLAPQKKLFVTSIIASILITLLGLLYSLFNKVLMDEVLPYQLDNELIFYSIGFGLVLIIKILMEVTRGHLVLFLSQKIDLPLMTGYFNHIFRLPISFFANRKVGDVTSRFQDAFIVKDILTNTALTLIIDILLTVISTIILLVMSPKLFLVLLVVTILSILLVLVYKGFYKKINKELKEKSAILNSSIIDSLKGISTIKANANEERVLNKIDSQYTSTLKTSFKAGYHQNIQGGFSSFISGIGYLIMMALGVHFSIKNELTIGTVLSFFTIASYFLDPVGRLVNLQLQIQEGSISLKRLGELYDIDEEEKNEANIQEIDNVSGNIKINNLSFRYGKRPMCLSHLNLQINAGEKIAFVGESGSGKSTLSKLLLKFYLPTEGSIIIDDKSINEINAFSLRRCIGYVPQEIELFSGTIADNLRVGKEDASIEEINHALKLAACNDVIARLPFGIESFIDESGGGLSGGEKQRIAIARALIKDPNLIIFDEATSSLDYQTENYILNMIYKNLKKKTVIIIAHRLSTIINCDKIFVLDKGEIIESGTHNELLKLKGKYKRLWDLQQGVIFDDEEENKKIKQDDGDSISY